MGLGAGACPTFGVFTGAGADVGPGVGECPPLAGMGFCPPPGLLGLGAGLVPAAVLPATGTITAFVGIDAGEIGRPNLSTYTA